MGDALKKVQAAKQVVEQAKHDEAASKSNVKSLEEQVAKAAKNVEKEMSDFEDCKRALEEAKQHLKDLLEKRKQQKKEAEEAAAAAAAAAAKQKKAKVEKEVEEKKKVEDANKTDDEK